MARPLSRPPRAPRPRSQPSFCPPPPPGTRPTASRRCRRSSLKPAGCEVHRMTAGGENSVAALEALASALGAKPADAKPQPLVELAKPTGPLTHASIAQAIAMAIPENAIVVDESITTGRGFFPPTAAAHPHDWLQNMGGSIGFSTPVATGAAVACPDRKGIV